MAGTGFGRYAAPGGYKPPAPAPFKPPPGAGFAGWGAAKTAQVTAPPAASNARPPGPTPVNDNGSGAGAPAKPLSYMFSGNTTQGLNRTGYNPLARPGGSQAPGAPAPTYGTQSGPTYVEDRYTSRANGTDPGWEYGLGRATDSINNQYAARGGYNSKGAMQSLGDMYSNSVAQREGQLDNLSAAASGAHQHSLDSMFTHGMGLANGQAGIAGAYDQATGSAMSEADRARMDLMLGKAGVDQKTRQGEVDAAGNLIGAVTTGFGGRKS